MTAVYHPDPAINVVVEMLGRVLALCDSSTTGMVSVTAVKDAIRSVSANG